MGYSSQLSILIYEPLAASGTLLSDDLGDLVTAPGFTLAAFGGPLTLNLSFNTDRISAEEWMQYGVGRHVEVYSPAQDMVWEGFVNSVRTNIGSLSVVRGPYLDIANKVRVVYSGVDTSTDVPVVGIRESTAWYEDADSQAKFGVLERIVSVGGATAATAAQIAQTYLEEYREPQTDETDNLASSVAPSVELECSGYISYLETFVCDLTTTGLQNASAKVEAVLGEDPNSIISTDYDRVTTNTTQVGAYDRDNRPALTIIKGITGLGDSSYDRWLFYFAPGRKAVYEAIPSTTEYMRRLTDPSQALALFPAGATIAPWNARAGKWVFYTDLLVGRSTTSDRAADPRFMFIEETSFTVPWALTLRGSKVAELDQLMARLGLGGTAA